MTENTLDQALGLLTPLLVLPWREKLGCSLAADPGVGLDLR